MMISRNGVVALMAAVGLSLGTGAAASAGAIPYPSPGTYNPVSYTFTAATTGDVVAYFAGSGASFDNQLGLLINGTPSSAGFGLDDHLTAVGTAFDLGSVRAGDTLTFVLENLTRGANAYSDPSLNASYDALDGGIPPGHDHVYSTTYDATSAGLPSSVPSGTYIGFEDLPTPNADFNYADETFVFTNVNAAISGAPEPATWALLLAGVATIGLAFRRRAGSALPI